MSNSFQEALAEEVREILSRPDDRSNPNHLKAIRHVRNSAGLSLKEAREFIENIRDTQKAQHPSTAKDALRRSIQQSEEIHSSVFIPAVAIPTPQVAGVNAELITALEDCCIRMERARNILTDGNPRNECNWGMLDTFSARAALSQIKKNK